MSFDYSSLAQIASALLADFGQVITLTRAPQSQTLDPVTGVAVCYDDANEVTPCAPVEIPTIGVNARIPNKLIDGSRVLATDRMLILIGTVEPRVSDKVSGWSIQEVTEVKPAATPLVYFARIRK